jgi:ABC-type dipeptide/oligopeptide/nickel transport system permease component
MTTVELGVYFLVGIFILGIVMGVIMAIFNKKK